MRIAWIAEGCPKLVKNIVDCDGVDSRQEPQQTSDKSLSCLYQPLDIAMIAYPAKETGKLTKGGQPKRRYFNKEWYKKFPWLHWSEGKCGILCFYCLKARSRVFLLCFEGSIAVSKAI